MEHRHTEASVLNWFWDFAHERAHTTGHPYYIVLAQDLRAAVRSYGSKEKKNS